MKLYGSIISPYVARVVYAARMKGLDLEAEMPANGIKSPEYLQINPLGKMPALDIGNKAIEGLSNANEQSQINTPLLD